MSQYMLDMTPVQQCVDTPEPPVKHHMCLQAAWSYVLGQIGDAVDVMPGEEFRVAVQEAGKVSGNLCK